MAIDSRFILGRSLQELFRSKVDGSPLRNGKVFFFSDNSRNTPKTVYKLSGSPPNYGFTALPNPVNLTGIGTFGDASGNDILPLYFPFQGTPDNSDGTTELYYVIVTDSSGDITNPEWTREGWPLTAAASTQNAIDITNYVPNGQFIANNYLPKTDTVAEFQIRQQYTPVAPGGWYFVEPGSASGTYFVSFERLLPVLNPTSSPRYQVRIKSQSSGSDTVKDLRVRFNDVNKFASETQQYTFSFAAKSDTGSNTTVELILIKNFGSGGDAETSTQIGSAITIGTSFAQQSFSFTFGTNIGAALGPNNDDYVDLAIRLTHSDDNILFDNFVLTPNQVVVEDFPSTTNSEFLSASLTLPIPRPNNMDLYLPIRSTLIGLEFDQSIVGKIQLCGYELTSSNIAIDVNELFCDGAGYPAYGYSSIGIPYRRLHTRVYDTTAKIPIWGCGAEYMNSFVSDLTPASEVRFETNKAGSVTAIDAKTSGLTVKTVRTGQDFALKGYKYGTALLYGVGTVVGSPAENVNAQNSGFTVSQLTFPSTAFQAFSIQTIAASAMTAGHYLTFSNTTTKYYIYFKLDGVGADPAPATYTSGGFIDLKGTYTADDVSNCLRVALLGGQVSTITAAAASAITGGTYFTAYTNSGAVKTFNFYFVKDGVGTAPSVSGTNIAVAIVGTDTAAQVADKIRVVSNDSFVGAPDFRNVTLRGYSSTSTWDYDSATRFTLNSVLAGNNLGTFEFSQFTSHTHTAAIGGTPTITTTATNSFNPGFNIWLQQNTGVASSNNLGNDMTPSTQSYTPTMTSSWSAGTLAVTNSATGGSETRPINAYVNYTIKY